jgi:hypothetical protein
MVQQQPRMAVVHTEPGILVVGHTVADIDTAYSFSYLKTQHESLPPSFSED